MINPLTRYWSQIFEGMYRSNDTFFDKLWKERRLKASNNIEPDEIDELSAKLVCATLHTKSKLLILLPDNKTWRSAFLFASGLIMHGLDTLRDQRQAGNVLYFGSSIGIKKQMENMLIGGTRLDQVFSQTSNTQPNLQETTGYLPKVLSIYSPADPISIMENNKVDWIAVDCGNSRNLKWLPSLLEYLNTSNVPVIAWAYTPFLNSIEHFKRNGVSIFQWPTKSLMSSITSGNEYVSSIEALIIEGNEPITSLCNHLKASYYLLTKSTHEIDGRLSADAVQLGWRLLKSLEMLSVPLDLFECEARNYWGLKSISETQKAFRRFIDALSGIKPKLSALLEEVCTHLDSVYDIYSNYDPPMWKIATEICLEDVSHETARVLVFPNKSARQLFSHSLLSKYSISELELSQLHIYLSDPRALQNHMIKTNIYDDEVAVNSQSISFPHGYNSLDILLVGLMSFNKWSSLETIMQKYDVKVLMYSYQTNPLAKIVEKLNEIIVPNEQTNLAIIKDLGGGENKVENAPIFPVFAKRNNDKKLQVNYIQKNKNERVFLWEPNSPEQELNLLFDSSENEDDEYLFDQEATAYEGNTDYSYEQSIYVDEAVYLKFSGGFYGLFMSSEKINVIVHKFNVPRIDERYISSIRAGDKVLFIEGQRRQSLYNLILSRVHQHPSIELHLALVHRWQSEIVAAWKKQSEHSKHDILKEMQQRGSKIESPLTISQWVRGDTLCPQDPKDLYRIADILKLDFVKNYHDKIYRAATRLRGLHRGISNRLNRWLRDQASGIPSGSDDDIFDEELGISLKDFRDSILILNVLEKEVKKGPFLRNQLGYIKMEG